jgi:hypothetical protein
MSYNKIVVFDLDETLGYFVELGIFINVIEILFDTTINEKIFNELMDLYPEFLRPNIIKILRYLKQRKLSSNKTHVMIYTNNQGPRNWVNMIKNYFETKINYNLFDQIIGAFKINGKIIEICRTSHRKSYDDFIRCTKLPKDAKICFLDDLQHDDMIHDNVYYINLKPYVYTLDFKTMSDRFINSNSSLLSNLDINERKTIHNKIIEDMKKYNFDVYNKTREEQLVDEAIGKKIIHHFDTFFNVKLNKTKRNYIIKSKTHKRRKY